MSWSIQVRFREGRSAEPGGVVRLVGDEPKRVFTLEVESISLGGDVKPRQLQAHLRGPRSATPWVMDIQFNTGDGVLTTAFNIELPDQGPGLYQCLLGGPGIEPVLLNCHVED